MNKQMKYQNFVENTTCPRCGSLYRGKVPWRCKSCGMYLKCVIWGKKQENAENNRAVNVK